MTLAEKPRRPGFRVRGGARPRRPGPAGDDEAPAFPAHVSWFKVTALIVNLAIVIYLLVAKRLFGLRGDYSRERAERERDAGWEALERSTPMAPPSDLA